MYWLHNLSDKICQCSCQTIMYWTKYVNVLAKHNIELDKTCQCFGQIMYPTKHVNDLVT